MVEAPTTPPTATTRHLGPRASVDFLPGQHFGPRYQIVEEIGRGGMGVVYKAIDRELDRIVALKMIRPGLSSDPQMVKQFKQELILASEISHENVIRIHDLGETGGIKYISMKYIDGTSLRDLMSATGRLTPEKTISIARQICTALAAAHRKGVIHRDLKPQNIMIDRGGDAHVMDFGIARSLGTREVTAKGDMLGTPHYMSPEQAQGKSGDERSDIYSLGCILYEMATGRKPFEADTLEGLIHDHIDKVPRAPSELNPVPQPLEAVILKAMQKDPNKRFQSAENLRDALGETASSLHPATATPGTTAPYPGSVKEPETSIAVLPFRDMSPEKDQEYFCDGMAEEIINALVKIEGLRVAALTSAFQFKNKGLDIRAIGNELNVGAVLEGSVRKAGNRLRVTAQLVNVADGYHAWSERYDRDLEDVFEIQDDIAGAIVEALAPRLVEEKGKPVVPKRTEDAEAYNLYLKGRYHWNRRTRQGIKKAIGYFRQAIDKDPTFALPHAGLADSYLLLEDLPSKEAAPKARAAALKALELDDTIAEAHTSLAWVMIGYDHDFAGGEEEIKKALQLNPSYATTHHWYALYLAATGRIDEALKEIHRAQELDPLSLIIYTGVAFILIMARRYDEAIQEAMKAVDMDPTFAQVQYPLVWAYDATGQHDKAIDAWAAGFELEGEKGMAEVIRETYKKEGYRAAMSTILDWLLDPAKPGGSLYMFAAMIAAPAGDTERALDLLETSYQARELNLLFLNVMPAFDSLRSEPRFQALLESLGFQTGT
jgi:TolB-like protein